MKKILITLTSSESKRLIAKYVSQMPMVKKTMAEGILNLQLSTTNGFIYEELSGNARLPSKYQETSDVYIFFQH